MGDVTFSVVDPASAPARWAMGQYFDELAARFPNGFDGEGALSEADATLKPPTGLFVVASLDDAVVGCGAIQFLDAGTGEIKRMWVSSTRRGSGLGRRLLADLEQRVAASGRARVVLDTNASLAEAIAMYGSSGYVATERYNENPYADLWFEKPLAQPGASTS